jgi:DNA-binding HxlR family transcriptional regulator
VSATKFRYHPAPMKVEFLSCPVQASLRILGREWAFLVLTSISLFRANRFNDMIRAMPGLSKRLLTMRLTELERAGFIVRAERRRGFVRWELTAKGADVVPILLTMVQFGAKWYADEVFEDQTVRPLGDIFDEGYIRTTLGIRARPGSTSSRASPGGYPPQLSRVARTARTVVVSGPDASTTVPRSTAATNP